MERLFRRFNQLAQVSCGPRWAEDADFFIQSVTDDGVIFLNHIESVVDSGNQPVFRMLTDTGKSLKATADHKILTEHGYEELQNLDVGDRVCVNPGKARSRGGRRPRPYRKEVFVKYHPSARTRVVNGSTYHRLYVYHAIYEAWRNNLSYTDYIALLNDKPRACNTKLWTIPVGHAVHHIDEDHKNNAIENLELIDFAQHSRLHSSKHGVPILSELESIVSIEPVGIEHVYDIVCANPCRNFVAGGIIVHNSGKSESVERLFRKRSQVLQIISCTPAMSADDFEGKIDIKDGDTVFTPSPCAIAVREGHGLLLDEVDAAPAEACYSLYRVLSGKDMRIARQGYEGVTPLHRSFRAVGTQNTEGRGDDRGIHHGRSYQDEAFLDRWPAYIRVDYPAFETEVLILTKRTGVPKKQAEKIVKAATELRRAFSTDRVMFVMTMRRTLAVASSIAAGFTPEDAWRFAVQNRATPEDCQTIEDFVNRVYGSTAKKPVS